jgi:hypothetical protein
MKKIIIILSILVILLTSLVVACKKAPVTDDKAVALMNKVAIVHNGVSATITELSAGYAVANFTGVKAVASEAQPDPQSPHDTLVTITFTTSGVNSYVMEATEPSTQVKIREAVPTLVMVWRVEGTPEGKITPYNFYAKDAIELFPAMVNAGRQLSKQ